MLFNLFGKKEESEPAAIFKDKIYINTAGKITAVLQLAKDRPNAIFMTWFSDTASLFQKFFTQYGLDENRVVNVHSVTSEQLRQLEPVFLEHHPLRQNEELLTQDWQHISMYVFSAMDEPLFKHFGSDKMIPLIKLVGMKESEAIEHSYVTESIVKGQNKIAAMVSAGHPATSQAAWMEQHLNR